MQSVFGTKVSMRQTTARVDNIHFSKVRFIRTADMVDDQSASEDFHGSVRAFVSLLHAGLAAGLQHNRSEACGT